MGDIGALEGAQANDALNQGLLRPGRLLRRGFFFFCIFLLQSTRASLDCSHCLCMSFFFSSLFFKSFFFFFQAILDWAAEAADRGPDSVKLKEQCKQLIEYLEESEEESDDEDDE